VKGSMRLASRSKHTKSNREERGCRRMCQPILARRLARHTTSPMIAQNKTETPTAVIPMIGPTPRALRQNQLGIDVRRERVSP
jgi:hypothetical protein